MAGGTTVYDVNAGIPKGMDPGAGGQKPDPRVLFYKETLPDGSVLYSSVDAWEEDPHGKWKALHTTLRFATEALTPKEGRLERAVAILAVLQEDVPGIVADAVAQATTAADAKVATLERRVKALELYLTQQAAKVRGPNVKAPPPGGTNCPECDFVATGPHGIEGHMRMEHPATARPA